MLAVSVCLFGLSACRMDEEDAAHYEQVLALALDEVGEENWKFTGQCCGWSGEAVNEYDQYNFYIDEENYNDYRRYWLEDVPEEEYRDGLNADLWETGDRVQHCINIYQLRYESDVDYMGVALKKDTDYYLVSVYEHTVFFRHVYAFGESETYGVSCGFSLGDESPRRMLYHQEGSRWIMENTKAEGANQLLPR